MAVCLIKKNNRYYIKQTEGKKYVKTYPTGIEIIPANGGTEAENRLLAEEILEKYRKMTSGQVPFIDEAPFVDFLSYWLNSLKGTLKSSTYEVYEKTVQGKIIPYFKPFNYALKDMHSNHFKEYLTMLQQSGRSDGKGGLKKKSIKNVKGILHAAFQYAVEEKILEDNPVRKSCLPSFENEIDNDVPTYTANEVKTLLNCAKEEGSHVYTFLCLALCTGMRKGEMMALTWDNVSFENKELLVKMSRTGSRSSVTAKTTTPKTEKSNRLIPIDDFLLDVLRAEKEKQDRNRELYGIQNNNVITNINGTPYHNLGNVNRVIDRLAKKAGLHHCTVHGLRHAVATMLNDKGVAVEEISELLGHSSTYTTEKIYIHKYGNIKRETTNLLGNAFGL